MSREWRFAVWGLAFATAIMAANPSACATNRAVSLRVLESVVKTGPSQEALRLCGITRMSGYVVDKQGQDIILFGKVDPAYPPLYLEDFLVALRNARLAYARKSGRTYYYSPPGCSIDPDPRVLRELQEIGDRISQAADPDERHRLLEEWQDVGRRPQDVRVLGVPFYTRFAKVMVDADYYMKRLVNGSVNLGIDGFSSLMDMDVSISKKAMEKGERSSAPSSSMNRFWFCPGESSYEENDGVVTLKSCRVRLLTEHQFLNVSGKLADDGRPDPLAKQFARSFTTHYDRIAAARPIYKELEGLFRFVALVKVMKERQAVSTAGTRLEFLTNGYRIGSAAVAPRVPGLTHYRELNQNSEAADGYVEVLGFYVSCGGVSMDVHPKRVKTVKAAKGKRVSSSSAKPSSAGNTRNKIIQARKSPKTLYWDFPK